MLKHILLLLGETASSRSASDFAFALARSSGAGLSGLSGIDLSFIEERMPGRAGGTAWKYRLEEKLKAQAGEIRARLREAFERTCHERNMPLDWLSFEGDPHETLAQAVETRDLVVTGHDTAFHGAVREQMPEMLSEFLKITPRPVIVCPDKWDGQESVLVAYDGSPPAMRALQLFTLLGLARSRKVQVVSVDENESAAARRAGGAATYLRAHGFEAEARPLVSRLHPSKVVAQHAAGGGFGLLVMGAYGHRGVKEFLFGSTTSALVENPPCALFIYH